MIRKTLKLKTSKTPGWDIFAIHSGLSIPSFIIVITYFCKQKKKRKWKLLSLCKITLLLSCSFLADRVSKTSQNFGEIFLHSCFPLPLQASQSLLLRNIPKERCCWLRCRIWCSPSMLSNLMAKNLFSELLEVFVLQFQLQYWWMFGYFDITVKTSTAIRWSPFHKLTLPASTSWTSGELFSHFKGMNFYAKIKIFKVNKNLFLLLPESSSFASSDQKKFPDKKQRETLNLLVRLHDWVRVVTYCVCMNIWTGISWSERGEKLINGDGIEPLSVLSSANLHMKAGISWDLQTRAGMS